MDYSEGSCQDLQDLLSGNLEVEYYSDMETLVQHWHKCGLCKESRPNAAIRIKKMQDAFAAQLHKNLVMLHFQYRSEELNLVNAEATREPRYLEKQIQVGDETILWTEREERPESEALDMQVLLLLESKGVEVRDQLQLVNDSWGLDYFRLTDKDCEYDSQVCGPLVASLTEEEQFFVFSSNPSSRDHVPI
jgi:hypothetical protein